MRNAAPNDIPATSGRPWKVGALPAEADEPGKSGDLACASTRASQFQKN